MALEPLGIQAVAAGVPGFVRDMGRMDKSIGKVGQSATQLGKDFAAVGDKVIKFGALAATALVGAAVGIGGALAKLAIDAAPLEGIAVTFNQLTSDIEGGSDRMLAALRKGSAGIASSRDLMTSFNLATALVSDQFAQQLPEALGPLGKVALATGQDLGFLLDSLVKGVGRLQPLILDNLGIQVNLNDAFEIYAKEIGKSTSELTKQEQQTALMNLTMAKLTDFTADLPEVSESATAAFGFFRAELQNLKDDIGLAILPAFKDFAVALQPIISRLLPDVVDLFRNKVAPALDFLLKGLGNIITAFLDTRSVISIEFIEALTSLLPESLKQYEDDIIKFGGKLRDAWEFIKTFFVDNKDEIITAITAIGTALATAAIFTTFLRIVSILNDVASPVGLLILAIGLLATAWLENWGGIREKTAEFWEKTGRPIFENILEWLGETLPPIIEDLRAFFGRLFGDETQGEASGFGSVLSGIFDFIKQTFEDLQGPINLIILNFGKLFGAIKEDAPFAKEVLQGIVDFITTTFGPTIRVVLDNVGKAIGALADLWDKHGENILDVIGFLVKIGIATFENFALVVSGIITAFLQILSGDWEGAFETLSKTLTQFFENALAVVGDNLDNFIATWTGILKNLETIVRKALATLLTVIGDWVINAIDRLTGGFKEGIGELGDFLGIGSPSRLFEEMGKEMMAGLTMGISATAQMPAIAMQVAAGSVAPVASRNIEMTFNQTVNSRAPAEPVAAEFQQMVATAERVSRRF